jgi:hypothetical protein
MLGIVGRNAEVASAYPQYNKKTQKLLDEVMTVVDNAIPEPH